MAEELKAAIVLIMLLFAGRKQCRRTLLSLPQRRTCEYNRCSQQEKERHRRAATALGKKDYSFKQLIDKLDDKLLNLFHFCGTTTRRGISTAFVCSQRASLFHPHQEAMTKTTPLKWRIIPAIEGAHTFAALDVLFGSRNCLFNCSAVETKI